MTNRALSLLRLLIPTILFLASFPPLADGAGDDGPAVYITGDHLRGRDLQTDEVILEVEGNVRFLEPDRGVFAAARTGTWIETRRYLRLHRNVEVFRDGTWIYGMLAVLDERAETLLFPSGLLVASGDRTIVADKGTFYLDREEEEADRVLFTGDVVVVDSTRRIVADSLEGDPGREVGVAWGNVSIDLYVDDYRIRGERAVFNRDSLVVTGSPVLEELDSLGAVAGTLTGDTITVEPERNRIIATGSTVGDYRDVRTTAGRTIMEADSHKVFLELEPTLVREGETMRGDEIEIRFAENDEEIDRVVVTGGANMESVVDDSLLSETGSTRGERITLYFEEGEPRQVEVTGGAVSDRSVVNREEGEREENHAEGDTLRFFMGDEELETIEVVGGATGDHLAVETDLPPEEEEAERVNYDGDKIRFDLEHNRIYLSGNAHVEQGTMRLEADRIRFDIDRSLVTAQGSPVLHDGEQQVDGERMIYSVDQAKGTIFNGVTRYDAGICYGEKIHRVSDKILLLEGGKYTSCDDPNPHYYFKVPRMKIFLDDKTVVRPIVFHIADIPLLALPYYLFPLKGGRSSGFILPTIEFGFSESKGRFIRNGGYFWAINDYADVTFRGDFFQDSHWIGYLDSRYRVRYLLNGSIRSSFKTSVDGRKRWSVQANHTQELGENLDLTMRGNFVSDKTYRVEESTSLEELDRTLKSDLVLKKRWKDKALSVQVTRTQRLDQERIDETLPSLSFTLNRRELFAPSDSDRGGSRERKWYNDLYYQYSTKILNSREEDAGEREDHAGWDHKVSTNFSRKIRGWLGYSNRVQWRETWYDRDRLGQKLVRRGMGSASASVNTNVYGTFFPRVGPLVGVRHIITPAVSFSIRKKNSEHFYKDEDGNEKDRFFSFGGFGGSQRSSRTVSFRLDNKLQTKYLSGEEEKRNDQLFLLSNSISYDLEKNRDEGEEPWSQFQSSLRFEPVRPFSSELTLSHNVYTRRFTTLSVRSSVRMSGKIGAPVGKGAGAEMGGGAKGEGAGEEAEAEDYASEEDRVERSPFEETRTEPYRGEGRYDRPQLKDSSVIPWTAQVSHRFSRGTDRGNFTQWLNGRAGISLSAGWEVDYENRYDMEEREIVSQGFRIRRDLHCWDASFRGRYSGNEWEYYFNIRIKAHPEIYYEKGERRLGF